jgi:radical SAM superfamily enzyme YgiQ (UPF0313 family)
MEKIKVLLPTIYDSRNWEQPYSAATMLLGANAYADPVLREAFDIRVKSYKDYMPAHAIVEDLLRADPAIVGFGAYVWNEDLIAEILPLLRSQRKDLQIWLGGQTVLYSDANGNRKFRDANLFFRGQADQAFSEVLHTYLRGDYRGLANGLCQLHGISNNLTFSLKVQERLQANLNTSRSYYLPDDSGMSFFERAENMYWDKVWWRWSEGCVYQCAFCGFDMPDLGFRHIPVDLVEREFEVLRSRPVREVYITDAILGGKRDNAKAVLRRIAGKDHNLWMYGFLRPEMLDEEFAQLLHEVNFGFGQVGLQTVNPNVDRKMRDNQIDLVRERLPLLAEYHIPYQVDLIAGFPGDNYEGFNNSFKFVLEEAQPTKIRAYRLAVLPGTPLATMVRTKPAGWLTAGKDMLVTETETCGPAELQTTMDFANFAIALYNLMDRSQWFHDEARYRKIGFFNNAFERIKSNTGLIERLRTWDQKDTDMDAEIGQAVLTPPASHAYQLSA